MPSAQELATVARAAIEEAVDAVSGRFLQPGLEIESKAAGLDVVTEADKASEAAISAVITANRPDDGFVGEEGTHRTSTSGITWIVDPLDSTANFAKGLPVWSVSIAAKLGAEVVVGAVASPATGDVFLAWEGGPLTVNDEPAPTPDRARTLLDALGVVGWDRAIPTIRFGAVLGEMVVRSGKVRSPGSPALGLAWTAVGRADFAYYEQSFKEWDVAAGLFMCQQRGLRTRLEEGPDVNRLLAAPEALFDELEAIAFDAD